MGIESNSYQIALVHLVREEMFRRGLYFEVEEIKHTVADGNKIKRVEGILQPRAAAGYLSLHRPMPQLLEQLLDWPAGKLDGPDVLAMAISLLDPYAAQATPDHVDLAKDVFAPWEQAELVAMVP